MELKFFCPTCKEQQQLEEILINVTQTSIISVIDDGGVVDYKSNSIVTEDGEIDHYQCAECGFVLELTSCTVSNPKDLVTWIKLMEINIAETKKIIKALEIEMKLIETIHNLDVDDLVELHNHVYPDETLNAQEVKDE